MAEESNTTQGTPLVPDGLADDWSDVDISLPTGYDRAAKTKDDEKDEDEIVEEEKDEPAEENNVEYVPNPGEYTPADYSFEVTTYDDEGNKPKSHKIASVEDWDKLMEDEPNFGSGVALTKAMRLANKMEINSERDLAEWQKKREDYDNLVQSESQQTQTLQTWNNEMDYLVERGDIPKIAKEFKDVEWKGDALKDEGVKAQIAILKYVDKENKARAKSGLKQITSMLDGYEGWARQQNKTTKPETTRQSEGDARKAAGARVASGSANPVGVANVPKGVAVGRGGSLDDLSSGWGWN